jgi:uncharacterized protein YxeA
MKNIYKILLIILTLLIISACTVLIIGKADTINQNSETKVDMDSTKVHVDNKTNIAKKLKHD